MKRRYSACVGVLALGLWATGCADDQGRPASDDTSGGAESGTDDGTEPPPLVFEPGEAVLPRLTTAQYRNCVGDLLGPDLPPVDLEPDTNPYLFFNIGASTTTLSELGTQQYEEAADVLTRAVFDDPQRRTELVGCDPTTGGVPCIEQFVASFGRRAYRRPLSDAEQSRWRDIAVELSTPDAWEGVRLATAGMLQSPHFLYRVELGEPDPDRPDRLRYTAHEMASRLSFLLWNTGPDDELLDAADTGDLLTDEGLRMHAERLLASPRANVAVQSFFAQYFDLGRLDGVDRDPDAYPMFAPSLPQAMRTEVELLVDDFVFRRDTDVRGLYGTHTTFVNESLAALYGIEAPGASPVAFVPAQLPEDGPRAGLLTLGAFLTMNAHESETSPTLRGKYLRERVLCQEVQPPPDDVDTDLDASEAEGATIRERLEAHRNDPACSGCHGFIDPPGYLFEHFDSLGNYRTAYPDGQPVDASGDLDGAPMASATDLAPLLSDDPRVATCIVKQLYRHAQGRLDETDETDIVRDLSDRFAEEDHRFAPLLVELVTHEGFRTLKEPS